MIRPSKRHAPMAHIRVGHSPGFGLPSVAILPWLCRKRHKATFICSTSKHDTLKQWWLKVAEGGPESSNHCFNVKCSLECSSSCTAKCWTNVDAMLAHCLWYWPVTNQTFHRWTSRVRRYIIVLSLVGFSTTTDYHIFNHVNNGSYRVCTHTSLMHCYQSPV